MHKFLSFLLFFSSLNLVSQVKINGISTHSNCAFEVGTISDYLSNEITTVKKTTSDTSGSFNFSLDINHPEKLFIKNKNHIGYLYAQPNATYFIEFPDVGFSNFQAHNEVELTFFQLDSNDINYKILAFEHWLDKSLNILYPLKEKKSLEFLKEIKKFRSAVNEIYGQEENSFFSDYVKYTLGVHIEELQDFASPNEVDKFIFYLEDQPIRWENDKYFDFITNFYSKYFYRQAPEIRQEIIYFIDQGNVNDIIKTLKSDSLVRSNELAEIVCLILVQDLYFDRVITKANMLYFLSNYFVSGSSLPSKRIAQNLYVKFNILDAGDQLPEYEFDELKFKNLEKKPIYIHFFNPTNKKCIAELSALKKLEKTYGQYIHFVTIYEKQEVYSKSERVYLDQIKWLKIEVESNHSIWKDLDFFGFPYYVYVLPKLVISNVNALGPSPSGQYETIERTFFEHKRIMMGEE
ncbi:MAG: hypothetical protein FJZ66_01240 [Bacteroidetes bacterium]|nr:hypothetical protein [Bacteroidota bacterium]